MNWEAAERQNLPSITGDQNTLPDTHAAARSSAGLYNDPNQHDCATRAMSSVISASQDTFRSNSAPASGPLSTLLDAKFVHYTMSNSSRQSNSSQASEYSPRYELMSTDSPADLARALSQNNKDQLVSCLRTHKINTITELRRVEKIFAFLNSEEVTEPMTSAWLYYVNSNNLLNELRGLTRQIPFSSECLDEAKQLAIRDPDSARSWNYCWLVLVKIQKENLILKYARALASKKSTWGDRQPTADDVRRFIQACIVEWSRALDQMLKHWVTPPTTTGA